RTPPRARAGRARRPRSPGGSPSGPDHPQAGEQVMSGEVLEGIEALADLAHVDLTIEGGHRLAQAEVAPGPGTRPREVAGEEPVRRPLAEAALRDDLRAHLLVGELAQRLE